MSNPYESPREETEKPAPPKRPSVDPLQSLGVVKPGEVLMQDLASDIAGNMGDGVQLVLTREPIGGKPEGVDAGPVVAEGAFTTV